MAQNSFALMTNLGRAKEAAALANGTAIVITHIAIGDGSTVPSGGETSLYNEVARKTISGHGTVVGAANTAYFDIFLAAADGPYTIREAGLYDSAGDLIAIARYEPPISKPVPSSGQTVEGTVRLQVAFSNIANVTIVVDPAFTVPLQRLSRLPWIPVLSMNITAPPATPAVGDAYLVPTGAAGPWAGHSGKIAEYTVAGWAIITPPEGHGVSLPDGRVFEKIGGVYVEKLALDTQTGKWNYAVAGGSADQLTANLTPAPSAYAAGMELKIKVLADNTGPATINVNGLGARPIIRASDMSTLKGSDLVSGRIASITYDGSSWLLSDVVTALAPLNRYFNRAGTSSVATVSLTPAASGAMHYGLLTKAITYNLPPAADFGVGYIGFMNNLGLGVTINAAAGVDRDEFQFMNNPKLKTITLSDVKSWVVLFCDGENWLFFSGDIGLNAKLGQSLSSVGYKKHDGGLIEQWGTSVVATTSSAYGTVYFPKPFPNRTFMVVAGSAMGNSGIANKVMSVFDTAAPDAFNFYADAPSTTLRINWMARGY
ncbi:phage tail protein [Brucella rhizosphaerae]|uniref:phage tail-collar fiber domain-containing protein n=1 Tax=Brucella rhizosphaerae TaxID=571254 RepID=UPI0004659B80|nr:phage tail protein [Brucella rhizosphaerae]